MKESTYNFEYIKFSLRNIKICLRYKMSKVSRINRDKYQLYENHIAKEGVQHLI